MVPDGNAVKPIFSDAECVPMDARLLDVVIGLIAFAILVVLLALLPLVLPAAFAYLIAIIGFMVFLSGAGYLVNEKIT